MQILRCKILKEKNSYSPKDLSKVIHFNGFTAGFHPMKANEMPERYATLLEYAFPNCPNVCSEVMAY